MNVLNSGAYAQYFSLALLTVAAAGVVLLTSLVVVRCEAARYRRLAWQAAVVSLALLVLGEMSGLLAVASRAVLGHSARFDTTIDTTVAEPETAPASVLDPAMAAAVVPVSIEPTSAESDIEFDPLLLELQSLDLATDTELLEALLADLELPAPETDEAEVDVATLPVVIPAEPVASSQSQPESVAGELLALAGYGIWCLVAIVLLTRSILGRILLRYRVARSGQIAAPELVETVARISTALWIRQAVQIREVPRISVPLVIGTWRPLIVVPTTFLQDFEADEQAAVLAHELGHISRRDPLWRLFADGVVALLWWHPASWWARRQLAAANETAADEASLVVANGPELLAGCLVRLGRQLLTRQTATAIAVSGSGIRSVTGRRVVKLLQLKGDWKPPRRREFFIACGFSLAMIATVLFSSAGARPNESSAGAQPMSLVQKYWKHSLVGATVAALLTTAYVESDHIQADHVQADDSQAEDARPNDEELALLDDPEVEEAKRGSVASERRGPRDPQPAAAEGERPFAEKRAAAKAASLQVRNEGRTNSGENPPNRVAERPNEQPQQLINARPPWTARQRQHIRVAVENLKRGGLVVYAGKLEKLLEGKSELAELRETDLRERVALRRERGLPIPAHIEQQLERLSNSHPRESRENVASVPETEDPETPNEEVRDEEDAEEEETQDESQPEIKASDATTDELVRLRGEVIRLRNEVILLRQRERANRE